MQTSLAKELRREVILDSGTQKGGCYFECARLKSFNVWQRQDVGQSSIKKEEKIRKDNPFDPAL